jgi:hypothetical protein
MLVDISDGNRPCLGQSYLMFCYFCHLIII